MKIFFPPCLQVFVDIIDSKTKRRLYHIPDEGAAMSNFIKLVFASSCMLITAQQKFPIWRTPVPVYSPLLSTSPLISNPIEVL